MALVGVSAFAFWLTRGGASSQEDQIRAYFTSSRGGGASRDQAKLIDVRECDRVGDAGEHYVVTCLIEHRDEKFTSCFEFQGDRLVGVARKQRGCETSVVWSPEADALIAR